jgi:hypothetical protein
MPDRPHLSGLISRRECLLGAAAFAKPATAASATVIVGDVFGEYEAFLEILRMAGVVGSSGTWAFGKGRLVQLGDVVDRGPKVRETINLLLRLAKDAEKAGGGVYSLAGHHEALRLGGDYRYLNPAEYEGWRTSKSDQAREKLYVQELANIASTGEQRGRTDLRPAYREGWEKAHPLGMAEMLAAFAPKGAFRPWVGQLHGALVLDDTLMVHGGISPKYQEWSVAEITSRVRSELALGPRQPEGGICQDLEGPLWWRGLATQEEPKLAPLVEGLLARHQVRRIVAGHTPTDGRGIVSRLGGRVLLADAGISPLYGAHRACVVVEGGRAYALDRGKRTPLD